MAKCEDDVFVQVVVRQKPRGGLRHILHRCSLYGPHSLHERVGVLPRLRYTAGLACCSVA
jgi:hypothetical protein